ncbi:uncharacterized protein LOC129220378 [Uloborus diversus]|uniref:uncharacterized protein LOC129220378 n=1 Tax=Uloborus diversus TaxID=327109 RepID=UPI00240A4944|nr:uncharacterized protein LOC129220378 [Uloborus diversus]
MSTFLVAAYDSSSSDDDRSTNNKDEEKCAVPLASAVEMLGTNVSNTSTSVFANPYREAENYEQSLLEKHVKMTTVKQETSNNKKICFKFFKNKCTRGDDCKFAHHNPIQNSKTENIDDDEQVVLDSKFSKVKKRCGLKDDLVPPKKYMKTFNKLLKK